MKTLAERTVLAHVLERCRAIDGVDIVCCATPDEADSDPIVAEAERCGAVVSRGSEEDVLDRYYRAAEALRADVVLRVTSDCPLIDPNVCAQVLRLRASCGADYAANNMPPTWPHGLDCEAFTFAALRRAAECAVSTHDREHVTPWLRRNSDVKRVNLSCSQGNLAGLRWTLDYPEDYEMMRELFVLLPRPSAIPGWQEIADLLTEHPEIGAINALWADRRRQSPKQL